MGLFSKIGAILNETPLGTLATRAIDRVLPDRLSEEEKARISMEIQAQEHQRNMQILEAANEQDREFNDRIKEMEGTSADLKTIPFIGPIVLFLRGVQRPLWGFATLYCDFQWFSGSWPAMTEKQETALIVINFLVLGFLFGERTLKNLTPLIMSVFGRKMPEPHYISRPTHELS